MPPTTVTLSETATASAGIPVQSPFEPVTGWTIVSPAPSGDERRPTVLGAGRVSNNRQGVSGTKVASLSPGAAETGNELCPAAGSPTASNKITTNVWSERGNRENSWSDHSFRRPFESPTAISRAVWF